MLITADSELGRRIKGVWHCEELRKLLCLWVNTETAQYCEYVALWGDTKIRQAKKIILYELVIYINPITDTTPSKETKNEVHSY